jgi:hypothetical protein
MGWWWDTLLLSYGWSQWGYGHMVFPPGESFPRLRVLTPLRDEHGDAHIKSERDFHNNCDALKNQTSICSWFPYLNGMFLAKSSCWYLKNYNEWGQWMLCNRRIFSTIPSSKQLWPIQMQLSSSRLLLSLYYHDYFYHYYYDYYITIAVIDYVHRYVYWLSLSESIIIDYANRLPRSRDFKFPRSLFCKVHN